MKKALKKRLNGIRRIIICKMQLKHLYSIALLEGEGLGTAYEYFIKLKLLDKYLEKNKIKDVLIYGLPEKYGFSLDFFYFCHKNNFNIFLFEKRREKIKRLKKILKDLDKKNIIFKNFKIIQKINKKYDLILSCEVLQALKENELKEYKDNIRDYSKIAIIFVPNKNNKSHIKFSGLNGFSLKELKSEFYNVKKSGCIDAPPFPPGIKKKEKIKSVFLIKILEFFLYIEKFIPSIIKKNIAHISYILIDNYP